MTEASLDKKTLLELKNSRSLAVENLAFYNCLYDDLKEGPSRDAIGSAMAQKQSFIGAIDAILKNHDIDPIEPEKYQAANDCQDTLNIEVGHHLKQEEAFQKALSDCFIIIFIIFSYSFTFLDTSK